MSKKSAIRIGDNYISRQHAPYIVAEMSGNHNQSIDRAMKIVEAAAQSGVHALKLQTYTADTITLDINEGKFFIKISANSFIFLPLGLLFHAALSLSLSLSLYPPFSSSLYLRDRHVIYLG